MYENLSVKFEIEGVGNMKIGIVTTWFERGAAYVSKIYKELLEKEGHQVLIFARGGDSKMSAISEIWNEKYVTRSTRYIDTTIERRKIFTWIQNNNLDAILFNEQQDFRGVIAVKKKYPNVIIGAYVDYYTEYTRKWFDIYDFLICNTKRHVQAMGEHVQKFYIKWGTDINLYRPKYEKHEQITFFHSVGMSIRKGTDILIDAFVDGKLYEHSKLIIHTQIPIEKNYCKYSREDLFKYNIEIIEKTVTAPGLYHKGDIYVYPTRLEGLGLTMYEALACGMPIIVTNFPPMNEFGSLDVVKYVDVGDYYCRGDAYYYPMAICDKESLVSAMQWFIDNKEQLNDLKLRARKYAIEHYDISDRSADISDIFINAKTKPLNPAIVKEIKWFYLKNENIIKKILRLRFIFEIK